MIELTEQLPADLPAIEALLDRAFGADRKRKISYRYRQSVGPVAELSRVARAEGEVAGTIRYWPVLIGEAGHDALLLGPVAVDESARGRRLGGTLIETTLVRAAALGHSRVLLVGDLAYYHRFGFMPAAGFGITMPGERPERLLLRPLAADAFAGITGALRPARATRAGAASIAGEAVPSLVPAPQPA